MQERQRLNLMISGDKYDLYYNESEKLLSLTQRESRLTELTARFFYDNSDGATLLSDFQYTSNEHNSKALAKLTADMVSDYLSGIQHGCKLLCVPSSEIEGEFQASQDYRASNIDRLMVREIKKSATDLKALVGDITLSVLDVNAVQDLEMSQIKNVLKQAYWADMVDDRYMQNAIRNSILIVARNNRNGIIGFVRAVSNNDFAYISDMVVDVNSRQHGIATHLMQQLSIIIDSSCQFSALFSAKEGDGLAAATKLYGDKFGFQTYDGSHQRNIYFRYIKLVPSQEKTVASAVQGSMFASTSNMATSGKGVDQTVIHRPK